MRKMSFLRALGGFRTIMAAAGLDLVGMFSSPDVLGESFDIETTDINDCARCVNETAEKIAGLKQATAFRGPPGFFELRC